MMPAGAVLFIPTITDPFGQRSLEVICTVHPDGRVEPGDHYTPELAVAIVVTCGLRRLTGESMQHAQWGGA